MPVIQSENWPNAGIIDAQKADILDLEDVGFAEQSDEEAEQSLTSSHTSQNLKLLMQQSSESASSSGSASSGRGSSVVTSQSSSSSAESMKLHTDNLENRSLACCCKSHKWQEAKEVLSRAIAFTLTHPAMSVVVMVLSIALSLGLGCYALFVFKPAPTIDKSVKAFKIPDHPASLNHDALEQAISDFRAGTRRGKRSVERNGDANLQASSRLDLSKYVPVYSPKQLEAGGDVIRYVRADMLERRLSALLTRESQQYSTHERRRRQIGGQGRDSGGRLPGRTQRHRQWKLMLVYLAVGPTEHNIFTRERLEHIHKVEMAVMNHTSFQDFCLINWDKLRTNPSLHRFGGCAPLNSLLTYFYPSQSNGVIHYDGLGSTLTNIDNTLRFAMSRKTFFWYVDDKINSTVRKSRLLRSEAHFGRPLKGYEYQINNKEQIPIFKENVKVLYGGNELFDYEVDTIFWNDIMLALFAVGFIWLLMFVLTSFSTWLSICGMVAVCLSFPMAFFFYRVVFRVQSLGILNGAAAFVVVGIGVDDVFVFVNTFRQAAHIKCLKERHLHTFISAGKATFFTSFTTAAAFAGNIPSSIPAIHEFGLFMSLIVASCWIMVVLFLPPVLNIWVRAIALCERRCYGCCESCSSSSTTCSCLPKVPADIQTFWSQASMYHSSGTGSSVSQASFRSLNSNSSADDVPLITMTGEDMINSDSGYMTYLGALDNYLNPIQDDDDDPLINMKIRPEPSPRPSDDEPLINIGDEEVISAPVAGVNEGCSLSSTMQAIVYHFIAKPVIKCRWVVFGIYLGIIVISIGLMTQLRPSTKPPQLFRAGTNLQMLRDLTTNFSDPGITCDECSAFFKEKPRNSDETDAPTLVATTTSIQIPIRFANGTNPLPTSAGPPVPPPVTAPPRQTPRPGPAATDKNQGVSSAAPKQQLQTSPFTEETRENSDVTQSVTAAQMTQNYTITSAQQIKAKVSTVTSQQIQHTALPTATEKDVHNELETSPMTSEVPKTLTTRPPAPSSTSTATTTESSKVTVPKSTRKTTIFSTVTSKRSTTHKLVTKPNPIGPTAPIVLPTNNAPTLPIPPIIVPTQRPPQPIPSRRPLPTQPAPQPSPGGRPVTMPTAASTPRPTDPAGVDPTYDPCAGGKCAEQAKRPNMETGAGVYVVFGIKGIDRTNVSNQHVLTERGSVIYDEKFSEAFRMSNLDGRALKDLCKICTFIAKNEKLVQSNASQCLPQYSLFASINAQLQSISECRNLPRNQRLNGRNLPTRALARIDYNNPALLWIAFAFESKTYKGQSYFTAYKEYQDWEKLIKEIKTTILDEDSPLQSIFQTSEFWKDVMMEIVAVSSAIYGLVLSLIICTAAVAIFTGHVLLMAAVMLSILGMLFLVVGLFFAVGWEMGAVEAVSLSILVGSSVDYCMHLVEGYLMAGRDPPEEAQQTNSGLRRWRTKAGLTHIGVSIISSAITTVIAAIPLTQTVILPFARFGSIVAINCTVSVLYTLTVCTTFLSLFAPARFTSSWKATLVSVLCTVVIVLVIVLTAFIVSRTGIAIPGPNGQNLFP